MCSYHEPLVTQFSNCTNTFGREEYIKVKLCGKHILLEGLYLGVRSGLHLALRDLRTLGDVDFTIAHSNLPKIVHLPRKDQN